MKQIFWPLLLFAGSAHAQAWANGQPCFYTMGYPFYTGPTAQYMDIPTGVIVDSVTGKVFVVDEGNNRVLRFPNFISANAEAVLGQNSFTTNTTGNTASTLNQPYGVTLDDAGNLWVADYGNNRVLRFANATTFANGASANMVIGQTSFTATVQATSTTGLYAPTNVFFRNNELWIDDESNNRILRYDNVNSKPATGASADGVLGQPNFTTNTPGTTAAKFAEPGEIFEDWNGNLWVADQYNFRVVCFSNATSLPNGASADLVLGQPNFTTAVAGLSNTTFHSVFGVWVDDEDRLYVADGYYNNRVLIFNNASALANGAAADNVLGQTDFASNPIGEGPAGLNNPAELGAWETGGTIYLFIADRNNDRIVIQTPSIPLAVQPTLSGRLQGTGQVFLQWQGFDETDISMYAIEYGTDGIHFNTVLTEVTPHGNSYSYLHESPVTGNNYYRVRIIHKDGSFSFSNVVVVNVPLGGALIAPNPARASITLTLPDSGEAEADFYNAGGMLQKRVTLGARVSTVDVHTFPSGTYFVVITEASGRRLNATLLKQ